MARAQKWDFFVSYSRSDRVWAEWIAWTLEAAGHRVLVQAWDMVPGTNWVFAVDKGIRLAERTIAVVSGAYLRSDWTRMEALGALRRDPLGRDGRLLVVRIERCRPEGPLGMIVRIDLFGLSEHDARRALLDGVTQATRGRAKPSGPVGFPGQGRSARFPQAAAPTAGEQRISLVIDVDGYCGLAAGDRGGVRARLLAMLFTALGAAGVRRDSCVVVDRVDGLAVILPAGFAGPAMTAALVHELCRLRPPVRTRVGVAAGTVHLTSWTFEGPSTATARLLASADAVRVAAARSNRTPNAVVVADDLYQVAAAGMPGQFTRIRISADTDGWIALVRGSAPASRWLATGSGVPVAAVLLGSLAAEEWRHLLDHEEGSDEGYVREGPAHSGEPEWESDRPGPVDEYGDGAAAVEDDLDEAYEAHYVDDGDGYSDGCPDE